MKKLLSILASTGLIATTAASVVACGAKQPEPPKNHKAKVPANPIAITLTETKKGEKLTINDKTLVENTIITQLKELNNDAVVNDDTFTLNLDEVTTEIKTISVDVKKTDSNDQKIGLEAGKVDVKLNLTAINLETKDANGLTEVVNIDLLETEKGKELTNNDKALVENTIITQLKDHNKDAVINADTFTLSWDNVTTESKTILVNVKNTQSTPEKHGLNEGQLPINVNLKDKTVKVLEKILAIANNEKGLVFEGFPTGEIEYQDVENKLKTELKEFANLLEFESVSFTKITLNKDSINQGKAVLNVSYDGTKLSNPDTEDGSFQFYFINQEYVQINQVLNQLKQGVNTNLTDFKVDLGEGLPIDNIGSLVELIGGIIKSMDLIPDKVPTTFDNSDQNWVKWTTNLNAIKETLKSLGFDIDAPIILDKKITIPDTTMNVDLHIETKISDVLNSILPDLIHFKNFMIEQRQTNNSENIFLLLIQYLFAEPKDINDDGFGSINNSIADVNKTGEFITFKTNLERLLHDLLEGWQTANGQWWKAQDGQGKAKDTVTIVAKVLIAKITLKYQTLNSSTIFDKKYGIFDLLPIENIKDFINQLLNYDLTSALTIKLVIPVAGETIIPIDGLGSLIKGGLTNILNTDKNLENQLNNLTFDWKQGNLKIEILKQNNEWAFVEKFEDILEAKDLRVKFTNNIFEIKSGELTFELENIDIIINLDIKSSSIC